MRSTPLLPAPMVDALRRAAGSGPEDVFVVGGFIRDRLLGRPTRDLDIAVVGDPGAVARQLGRALDGHAFALSADHGVWRVTPRAPGDGGIEGIDVAALRGDLRNDLGLRDFTINAIAAAPEGGAVHDPFGGLTHLEQRTLQLVADHAMRDDPLRGMRAARHAVELGFDIDPGTAEIIRRDALLLGEVAGERQRDELMRIFETDQAARGVRLLDGLGLLDVLTPELAPAKGCEQPKEHYWNVFDHSVETVAALDCLLARGPVDPHCSARSRVLWSTLPAAGEIAAHLDQEVGEGHTRRGLLKLIGLLHDVSKPETKTVDETGRTRFFGHPDAGAVRAGEIMRRLRFSAREVKLAEQLIAEHLRPGQLAPPGEMPTARALYRLYRDLGSAVPDLLLLNLADGAAAAGPRQTERQWRGHIAYAAWILQQARERESLVKPRRLVTGRDLIAELGMEPGAALGRVLDALDEAEATGEVTTREGALARARELIETGS